MVDAPSGALDVSALTFQLVEHALSPCSSILCRRLVSDLQFVVPQVGLEPTVARYLGGRVCQLRHWDSSVRGPDSNRRPSH